MKTRLCEVSCLVCAKDGIGCADASGVAKAQTAILLPRGWYNGERLPGFAPVCSIPCLDAWRSALVCNM